MSGSKISAIEYYFPKKRENNKKLKKINPKWDIKKIKEKTGIDKRYISGINETILDIGEKSIKIQACEGDIVFVPRGSQHSITTVNGDDSLRLPVTAVGDFHINTNGDDLAPSPRT